MRVVEIIFSLVFNILSIYIDFRIISIILMKKRLNRHFAFCVYFLVWLLNWGIYYLYNNVYLTSASLIVFLLLATIILYQGSMIRKIVAVCSSVGLGIVVDDIVWRICLYIGVLDQIEMFGDLMTSLILILLILLIERCVYVSKPHYITKESYANIIIVLFGNIILVITLYGIPEVERLKIMVVLISICLIDISVFYLYDKVSEIYHQKFERQMMEQQIRIYKNQFDIIQQSQRNIESMRHDIKKHLYLIKVYLEKDCCEDAKNYINKIENYMLVSGQYVNTGNQELDAILNYSLGKATRMSCKIETMITVPNSSFMSEFDLNMLLGNLLDNALEALDNVKKKYLFIGLSYHCGVLLIRIWNSYDGTVINEGGIYITRKNEKDLHGIGLKNITEIVKKYNGEQLIETTNELFKIDIVLYLKNE